MKYRINFSAREQHRYYACVEASSDEVALELIKTDPWKYVEEEYNTENELIIDDDSFEIEKMIDKL
jgi:hypothetical protein